MTPDNWHRFDFLFCTAQPSKTARGILKNLPMQGPRWYHVSAASFALNFKWLCVRDFPLGIRATGRLKPDVFREFLDKLETAPVEAHTKKMAWNQFVGACMIENDIRYRVFTGSESLQVPFLERILRKPAPGGF